MLPAWMTGGAPGAPSGGGGSAGGGPGAEPGGGGGGQITSVEDALAILEQFGKVGGLARNRFLAHAWVLVCRRPKPGMLQPAHKGRVANAASQPAALRPACLPCLSICCRMHSGDLLASATARYHNHSSAAMLLPSCTPHTTNCRPRVSQHSEGSIATSQLCCFAHPSLL